MDPDGPKCGQEDFSYESRPCRHFGQNAFGFEIFLLMSLDSKFPDFQVPDFQKSGLGQAWAGPGLGRAGLRPGLGLGPDGPLG